MDDRAAYGVADPPVDRGEDIFDELYSDVWELPDGYGFRSILCFPPLSGRPTKGLVSLLSPCHQTVLGGLVLLVRSPVTHWVIGVVAPVSMGRLGVVVKEDSVSSAVVWTSSRSSL